jgi:SAM-dependent methyltransferase
MEITLMEKTQNNFYKNISPLSPILLEDAFTRLDDSCDEEFYQKDRFVSHLDSMALSTVERIIGTLIVEKDPVILDLMAGWDSHIPRTITPSKVIGLGLNENELKKNKRLTEYFLHDLNHDPILPFQDCSFDAVLNTVSVDYITNPIGIFKEVGRILNPGGLFLVIFSNRMFPQKAVKVWRDSNEEERIMLVEEFFNCAELFEKPRFFVSKGRPRPESDKYSHLNIPSDPVYALYAEKRGTATTKNRRPSIKMEHNDKIDTPKIDKRKQMIKDTLCCPHCGEKLSKWKVPDNPFCNTWDNEYMYICFNDSCPYYVRGWEFLNRQGNAGSYRLMYNPEKNTCQPVPVPTSKALRESIAE